MELNGRIYAIKVDRTRFTFGCFLKVGHRCRDFVVKISFKSEPRSNFSDDPYRNSETYISQTFANLARQ